jgi:DNA polymerase III, subunit gamma and tau
MKVAFLDLIEVDAASRTKVEDTRDLLDNAQYAPSHGNYKVYIIDEIHMLSGHSFNALLKTLEEPPPHVKFLLATTDPHKIPVTVLSRCLQFNLKRLLPAQIFVQMEFILQQENINFETAALKLLSRAADGSMRDALSLLDQAIVYGNGSVSAVEVRDMLGTVGQQPVEEILIALAQNNASAVLNKINEIADLTPDFSDVLHQILQVLHRIALIQQIPTAIDHDFDNDLIASLSSKLSPEDVQLFYQIGLVGQRDLNLAPDLKSGFEMVMLRMLTFKPVSIPHSTVKANTDKNNWLSMIIEMKLTGATKEFANNCVLENIDEKVCSLIADPNHIKGSRTLETLETALQNFCGAPIKLIIKSTKTTLDTPAIQLIKEQDNKQQNSIKAINSDPNIQALKDNFNARVLPGTIKPI